MAINLTTAVSLGNGTRVLFADVKVNEQRAVMTIDVELRTAVGTNLVITQKTIQVRDGKSDRISRNAAPAAGSLVEALLVFEPDAVTTPTGYTDAFAAWKAGATPAARRANLEAHALTVGATWYNKTGAESLIGT